MSLDPAQYARSALKALAVFTSRPLAMRPSPVIGCPAIVRRDPGPLAAPSARRQVASKPVI